jgi:fucose 4-O-acetylase-like acetyltransferase
MAGILTLKPVFLTPLWLVSMSVFETSHPKLGAALGILPAIVVTALVIVKFRAMLFGYDVRLAARFLIMLDILRWMSTLVLSFEPSSASRMGGFIVIASISAPTLFAFAALVIVVRENKRPQRKQKRAEG